MTEIKDLTFRGCTSLENIDIPNSVTSIGQGAFYGCSSLENIDIPNSVNSIGKSTFYNCSALSSIKIPNGILSIGDKAFGGCSSLSNINIPKTVTFIGKNVFCEIIEDIEDFDEDLFFYPIFSTSLASINVDPNNTNYFSEDGILFSKDMKHLIIFPPRKNRMEYQIPSSVESIYDGAFGVCKFLQSIDIPASVTSISQYAFYNCESLQIIRIHHQEIEKCKIAYNIFEGIDLDQCTLYIPSGTRWAYRHHPVFSKFKNIVTERQA